jgi:lysine biosynthesis protein LysW
MNKSIKSPKKVKCPDCASIIVFHKPPKNNQLITCKYCGELLEVVSITPLVLDSAFQYEFTDEQSSTPSTNAINYDA